MAKIYSINTARDRRLLTVQEAWDAWVAADDKAKTSRRIEDGIAAGKAWARWLALFERRA